MSDDENKPKWKEWDGDLSTSRDLPKNWRVISTPLPKPVLDPPFPKPVLDPEEP